MRCTNWNWGVHLLAALAMFTFSTTAPAQLGGVIGGGGGIGGGVGGGIGGGVGGNIGGGVGGNIGGGIRGGAGVGGNIGGGLPGVGGNVGGNVGSGIRGGLPGNVGGGIRGNVGGNLIPDVGVGGRVGANLGLSAAPANVNLGQRGTLGVRFRTLDRGVNLTQVYRGSAAARAGLLPGDTVLAVNGNAVVRNSASLGNLLNSAVAANGRTTLRVLRNGQIQTMNVGWDRPLLGIRYRSVANGLAVTTVNSGSLAAQAGLRTGDVLLSVNDTAIRSGAQLTQTLGIIADAGGTATLGVLRGGERIAVRTALGAGAAANVVNPVRLGVRFQARDNGIVLTQVAPNSLAANAGLTAGDWILGLNGTRIQTGAQLRQQLQVAAEAGDALNLRINRNGQESMLKANIQAGADAGANVGAGAEAGADVDAGTGANVGGDIDVGAGVNVNGNLNGNIDAGAGADVDGNVVPGANIDAGAGADADANVETPAADVDLGTGADADAGAGANVDPADVDLDAGVDTDIDADAGVEVLP